MKKLIFSLMLLAFALPAFTQESVDSTKSDDKEKLTALSGKVDGMEESYLETKATASKLAKIKVSGYIQAQLRMVMDTAGVMDSTTGGPANGVNYLASGAGSVGQYSGGAFTSGLTNQVQIRRGRLKVGYETDLTSFYVQFDASANNVYKGGSADVLVYGFGLKDAYFTVKEPWLKSIGLQAGLFDRPYGYEIHYSSSSRESPERSRVCQTLFPGEREMGAMIFAEPTENMGMLKYFTFKGGFFNGQGINPENDNSKDFIGRLGFTIPLMDLNLSIDGGVSAYLGKVTNTDTTSSAWTTKAGSGNDTTYTWTRVPGSSADSGYWKQTVTAKPSTKTTTARGYEYEIVSGAFVKKDSGTAVFNKTYDRQYFGGDLQVYYDMPVIGGAKLMVEASTGKEPGTSSSSDPYNKDNKLGRLSNTGIYMRNFQGYYIMYVQNVFKQNQLVVKYDSYDPNTDVAASAFQLNSGKNGFLNGLSAADLQFNTVGLGWIYHWDENLKFELYYDMLSNEIVDAAKASVTPGLKILSKDYNDDVLTLRAQYKF